MCASGNTAVTHSLYKKERKKNQTKLLTSFAFSCSIFSSSPSILEQNNTLLISSNQVVGR